MTGPAAPTQTRSIVLVPSRHSLMEEVGAALSARSWEAVKFHDPTEALAELAALERLQQARANWGLLRTVASTLVVVEPNEWTGIDELLDAAAHYFPDAQRWIYENGRLSSVANETRSDDASIAADYDSDVHHVSQHRQRRITDDQPEQTHPDSAKRLTAVRDDAQRCLDDDVPGSELASATHRVMPNNSLDATTENESPCDEAASEDGKPSNVQCKDDASEDSFASTVSRDELDMLLETASETRSS